MENTMAIRKIIKYGHPTLRKESESVNDFGDDLQLLIDDMFETMYAGNGVGLSAVQVGVLKRVFIIDLRDWGDGKQKYICINPKITHQSMKKQSGEEGCMSIPGIYAPVERPLRVKLKAYDRTGAPFVLRAHDFLARAILHEFDHLNGKLFIDYLSGDELAKITIPLRKIKRASRNIR